MNAASSPEMGRPHQAGPLVLTFAHCALLTWQFGQSFNLVTREDWITKSYRSPPARNRGDQAVHRQAHKQSIGPAGIRGIDDVTDFANPQLRKTRPNTLCPAFARVPEDSFSAPL